MIEQSFMKALFHGVIAEELIFPFPEPGAEEADNIRLLLDSVRRFMGAKVDAARIDREHKLPPEVLAGARELGLFGL
ncbi:MAG TPA: acyl-CoA dehydrogenase family protein, partial [Polyangiaceae bacterium]|nr:acyl-CoA dehydrogenase family protein [Polyangiaceae bacterium]